MAIGITHDGADKVLDANPNADENYGSRPNTIVFHDGNSTPSDLANLYNLIRTVPTKYLKRAGSVISEMTSQEKSTVDATAAADAISRAKQAAKNLYDALDAAGRAIRAVSKLTVDEINTLRARDRDRSADVAAATSLADLKTRWAARSALEDRTYAQAKAAIQNLVDSE